MIEYSETEKIKKKVILRIEKSFYARVKMGKLRRS